MNAVIKTALVGAIAVALLDTSASFLALWLGANYGWFSIGSFSFYVLFGYLGARNSRWFVGAFVGMFMGLVDSTIGWAISWQIGPGKPADFSFLLIAVTIGFVVFAAGILGLIGGACSLVKNRNA